MGVAEARGRGEEAGVVELEEHEGEQGNRSGLVIFFSGQRDAEAASSTTRGGPRGVLSGNTRGTFPFCLLPRLPPFFSESSMSRSENRRAARSILDER